MIDRPSSSDKPRVLRFRHRRSDEIGTPKDLAKYEQSNEPDDYHHRMIMNAAALIIVTLLIGAGLWIASTMAAMRKNQDCVLSGRRGCSPVEITHERR